MSSVKITILGSASQQTLLPFKLIGWAKPDDVIAAYLQSFGRYGLPFNAVFAPRAPNGLVLPELLT
jgi:thiol:disulfide interchange protein